MIRDFDASNITKADMNILADHLEQYLEVLEEIMIIPEEIYYEKKYVERAKKTVRKLIKKLREGDKDSVFKHEDMWNTVE